MTRKIDPVILNRGKKNHQILNDAVSEEHGEKLKNKTQIPELVRKNGNIVKYEDDDNWFAL